MRSASIHEARERMGVSHMLEHMVFKGTRNRTAKDIALALEVLGGSLDAYTARSSVSRPGDRVELDYWIDLA